MLLVSAHRPTPLLSWTQFLVTVAPLTSQNLPHPVHPHPAMRDSQSSVLLPLTSLWSMEIDRRPSFLYMLNPYWPLAGRQLSRTTFPLPTKTPAPSLSLTVERSTTQPSPPSWLTTPSSALLAPVPKFWMVR